MTSISPLSIRPIAVDERKKGSVTWGIDIHKCIFYSPMLPNSDLEAQVPDSLADDIANRPTNQSVDYFGYGSRGYLPAFMQALKTAVFAALLLLSSPALAVGDRLIEAIMRSDFVFDKTISNVPFFPLGFLSFKYNDSLTLQEGCSSNLSCDLSYHRISQGFGLPVWVGQRDMIILAETLDSDKLEHAGKEVVLNDVGVLAAWISQPATEWQLGAFTYFFESINSDDSVKGSGGAVLGGHRAVSPPTTFS